MASRSGGGAGWFIVGFLAGVGATLAVIIFATRPQPTRVAIPALTAPAGPVVTYHAPSAPYGGAAAPGRPPASGAPAYVSGPAASSPATDRQTQEDAAAAGMTSRTRRGG